MCLSKVYVEDGKQNSLVVEEAARVVDSGDTITIHTLFGESEELEGYRIREIDLVKNRILLEKRGKR